MRGLSAEGVLAVWERGHGKQPVHYALDLYAAACPDEKREALALHSIGKRDRALLGLREATLGTAMQSVVACPQCGETMELIFNTNDFHLDRDLPPCSSGELAVSIGGYELQLRAPNSLDVTVAMESSELAEKILFNRCLVLAKHDGKPVRDIPEEIAETMASRLAEIDPGSDIRLNIACASCGRTASVLFDIAAYFWSEIEWWAKRLLGEVHELASAYGWSEREILSLSPARRESYLRAVRS